MKIEEILVLNNARYGFVDRKVIGYGKNKEPLIKRNGSTECNDKIYFSEVCPCDCDCNSDCDCSSDCDCVC